MDLTERIAEYITTTGLEDFPPNAIDAAKAAITDCLGCALAGSPRTLGRRCYATMWTGWAALLQPL